MFLVLGSAVGFAADVVCDFVAGAVCEGLLLVVALREKVTS